MPERNIVTEQFCQNKENENKFTSWNIPADSSFMLVWIGKHGGEKFRSYKPVSAKDIFDMATSFVIRPTLPEKNTGLPFLPYCYWYAVRRPTVND